MIPVSACGRPGDSLSTDPGSPIGGQKKAAAKPSGKAAGMTNAHEFPTKNSIESTAAILSNNATCPISHNETIEGRPA
mgnify:CR=1 FL=1